MYIRTRKIKRALRKAGLPTEPMFIFLALLLMVFAAYGAAYATSDTFSRMSVQSLMRQLIYNETHKDAPITVDGGGIRNGLSFSVPYEKIEPNGETTRRGIFRGELKFDDNRIDINGQTHETYSAYKDSGERRITTEKDGTLRIETQR